MLRTWVHDTFATRETCDDCKDFGRKLVVGMLRGRLSSEGVSKKP